MKNPTSLTKRLNTLRGRWRRGIVAHWTLLAACSGVAAIWLLGFADILFALPSAARVVGLILALGCVLFALFTGFKRASGISRADTATRADHLLGDSARPVLSGLELEAAKPESALAGWLSGQAVAAASGQLQSLPSKRWRTTREIGRATALLALLALGVTLSFLAFGAQSRSAAARLLSPNADIPPFSKLQLLIEETPSVIYGDDVTLNVSVRGGEPDKPVLFIARRAGKTSETPCFAAGDGRFSQKLENVVSPVEFAFRCGRARSRWHRVEVLLQPKFAATEAVLTPPAYSGLPERRFAAGEEPIAALAGTAISLRVTSNRPLASGSLRLLDPDNGTTPLEEITADTDTDGSLIFRWSLATSADIEVEIRDLTGSPSAEPLRLRQRRLADHAPQAEILSPGSFALATPDSIIPFEARADDDFGLRSLDLTRSLGAYRQRVLALEVDASGKKLRSKHYRTEIDLGKIGAEAGQTIEYFLEATDHNPDFTGIGASLPSRVEIISTDEYRQLIRARTTIADFMSRYRAAEGALMRLESALLELEKAANAAADTDEPLQKARKANRLAANLMHRLSRDFAAYDLEQELIDRAGELWRLLNRTGGKLANLEPGDANLAESAIEMLEMIAPGARQIAGQAARAEDVANVGAIMRLAVRFRKLHGDQLSATGRLRRFADDPGYHNPRLLKSLAREERRLATEFENLRKAIITDAKALPEDFADLSDDAALFAKAMGDSRTPAALLSAATSSDNMEGAAMHRHATLALESIDALLDLAGDPAAPAPNDNAFAALARGQTATLKSPPDVKNTLEQMLRALTRRLDRRGDEAQGAGQGGFGVDRNGGRGGGETSLNVPMFGPERLRFGTAGGSGGDDNGTASGRGGAGATASEATTLTVPESQSAADSGFSPDEIPEKYRDAVRRYLSKEDR